MTQTNKFEPEINIHYENKDETLDTRFSFKGKIRGWLGKFSFKVNDRCWSDCFCVNSKTRD